MINSRTYAVREENPEIRVYVMKRLREKSRRLVKYWLVTYKQASGRERLYAGMFFMLLLTYVWWAMIVF
jgi:hypothetical protein